MSNIGTLNEKSLHISLKQWYCQPGDQLEVPVGRHVIDIVRGDQLIEIQTRNFAAIKRKLYQLVEKHEVRLVYPIAELKWVIKLPTEEDGEPSRRRSPKQGNLLELFNELVSFPELLNHKNFSLHVLLIAEEEVRRFTGKTNWRRKGWVTQERKMLYVVNDDHLFENGSDLRALIPHEFPGAFTVADLVETAGISKRLAGKMAYCLKKAKAITAHGKRGNAILYHM